MPRLESIFLVPADRDEEFGPRPWRDSPFLIEKFEVLCHTPKMLQIGRVNKLEILSLVEDGAYLNDQSEGEIFLPLRDVPELCAVGDTLDVFICYDSNDRLIATMESPKVQVGEFAVLTVIALEPVGAFLDWGLSKDLFLPFSEQTRDLFLGEEVIVFVYLDNTDRISASMRLEKHLNKTPSEYLEEQSVKLLIYDESNLGYKALIDGKHFGVLYHNEVFQALQYGQVLSGFIKKIREDGKIDLSLSKTGHQGAADIAPQILDLLNKNKGFLAINDKTSAEKIYELFGVSKKKYKIALGGLYKKRLITVGEDGIHLVP